MDGALSIRTRHRDPAGKSSPFGGRSDRDLGTRTRGLSVTVPVFGRLVRDPDGSKRRLRCSYDGGASL